MDAWQDHWFQVVAVLASVLVLILLIRGWRDRLRRAREMEGIELITAIPKRQLSTFERIMVLVVVVVLAPIAISPRLSLFFVVFTIPPVFGAYWIYRLIRAWLKGKAPTPTAARAIDLSSIPQAPLQVKHHWTVSTDESGEATRSIGKKSNLT